MKSINEIREDFNQAIAGSYDKNQAVIQDIEFAKLPGAQWRGSDEEQFRNKPKPENNKLARQINRILGQYHRMEMNAKIITASDDAVDEDAELLQSRWRNDFNASDGVEALQNAADEAFHGGFGAFKEVAVYDDEESPNADYQHIEIKPIYSAASSVVFNAGALRKDKRDAKQAWHLVRVNRRELEEEYGYSISSFPHAVSDVDYFDWACDGTKDIYIAHYYEVVKKRVTEYNFGDLMVRKVGRKITDQFGNKLDKEDLDFLMEEREHSITKRNEQYVEYALLDGNKFLEKATKTPFKTVPIFPQYGYHQVINGIEYYCGEVCRQRDNQRFLNMGFGAMMEIMAQNQTETPEYTPGQVQRFATMHANKTVEGYPYLLSDPIKDENGKIAHLGPVSIHSPPQIGSGLAGALDFLNNNITEQGGTGQTSVPANASAEAIQQVNDREDDSYQPMFQNAMQTIKAACEAWIPAAQKLYFTNQRQLRVQGPDDSYSRVTTLQYAVDPMNGQYGPFKNAARGKYDVIVKAGETHKAMKQAEKDDNLEILQYTDTATPKGQMILNNVILSTTGEGTEDARRIARFENLGIMLSMGIDPQPKNEEEQNYIQQLIQQQQAAAQQQQPDPLMIQALAQDKLANAELIDKQVDQFNAETKRIDTLAKVQESGAKIGKIQAEIAESQQKIRSGQVDDQAKIVTMYRGQ